MRAFGGLQRQDQLPYMAWPVRVRAILPAAGDIHLGHMGIERRIGLVENHAAGHVQHVLHARATIGRRLQFRQIVGNGRRGIDKPATDQDARHRAYDRFGHGLG